MDWQSIQPVFDWLADHSILAGLFIFLIAFSESLLIIGLIVPGTILMFGVGTLVGAGALDLWNTIIIAFFGAVAGDAISFLIGKHYHDRIIKMWPFNKHPNYFHKGEVFFKKHGGVSILFGRFVGPVRPIIPAVAGMMGMSQPYFLFVNVLSAAGWAPFYLIPGILFGSSLELATTIGARLIIFLLLIISAVLIVAWILKLIYISMLPWIQRKFIIWYEQTLIGRKVLHLLFDVTVVKTRGGVILFALGFFLLIFLLAIFIKENYAGLVIVDKIAIYSMRFIQWRESINAMQHLENFFNWISLFFVFINLIVLSVYFKQYLLILRVSAILFFFAILFFILQLAGLTFVDDVFNLSSSNFEILKFAGIVSIVFLFFLLADQLLQRVRKIVACNFLLAILLIAFFTWLYFAKISFSSGLVLISTIAPVAIMIFWGRENSINSNFAKMFTVSSVCVVILFFGLSSIHSTSSSVMLIGKQTEIQSLTTNSWWSGKWDQLDKVQEGLTGNTSGQFNLQWTGSEENIQQALMKHGWNPSEKLELRNLLLWLSPDATLDELGSIPGSHQGLRETFTFYKTSNDSQNERLKLQFWKQQYSTESGGEYWLAILTKQKLGEMGMLFNTIFSTQSTVVLEELRDQLRDDWQNKIVYSDRNNEILLLKHQNR